MRPWADPPEIPFDEWCRRYLDLELQPWQRRFAESVIERWKNGESVTDSGSAFLVATMPRRVLYGERKRQYLQHLSALNPCSAERPCAEESPLHVALYGSCFTRSLL